MKTFKTLGLSLVALSLLGIGCNPFAGAQKKLEDKIGQSVSEKILEGASGGKGTFDITDEGITIKDKETGESMGFGAGAKIPAGFPSDIPRYDGSVITIVSLSQDTKKAMLGVTMEGKTVAELSEWYDAKLIASGYERTSELNASGLVMNEYKKGKVTLNLVVSGEKSDGKDVGQVQITRVDAAE
jgi:hypothetical protein